MRVYVKSISYNVRVISFRLYIMKSKKRSSAARGGGMGRLLCCKMGGLAVEPYDGMDGWRSFHPASAKPGTAQSGADAAN